VAAAHFKKGTWLELSADAGARRAAAEHAGPAGTCGRARGFACRHANSVRMAGVAAGGTGRDRRSWKPGRPAECCRTRNLIDYNGLWCCRSEPQPMLPGPLERLSWGRSEGYLASGLEVLGGADQADGVADPSSTDGRGCRRACRQPPFLAFAKGVSWLRQASTGGSDVGRIYRK
jgi:hypothetical protein